MAADNILRSYADVSKRESILGLVEVLTATEKSIMNMIGKTRAIDTSHSVLLDTLDTPASGAVAEAADYTAGALTTPTRLANVVQVVAKPFKVSRTQQAIDHYHGENELVRQTNKKLKDFGNSVEFDLVRSTLVSGASGTVAKMEGIIAHISKSTTYTAQTSGTVWSASLLKGQMKNNMDNSNGDVATDIFMGSGMKDKTDDFANKSTNVVTGLNVKEVVLAVDVFETGLGKVKSHYHRYVQQSSDTTNRILGINPAKHKTAYLEEPYIDKDLARTGPFDFYAVTGSMTLETRNQDSNFFAIGYLK